METVSKEYGDEILHLPPYHCELNPIELAWAAEKNYVAGENKDMFLDSVDKLFRKKREELPEDFWRKSPHITSAQYCGGCSVHWRLFSTSGG